MTKYKLCHFRDLFRIKHISLFFFSPRDFCRCFPSRLHRGAGGRDEGPGRPAHPLDCTFPERGGCLEAIGRGLRSRPGQQRSPRHHLAGWRHGSRGVATPSSHAGHRRNPGGKEGGWRVRLVLGQGELVRARDGQPAAVGARRRWPWESRRPQCRVRAAGPT